MDSKKSEDKKQQEVGKPETQEDELDMLAGREKTSGSINLT